MHILEFTKLATLVRYDMLGYEQEEKGHLSELIDLKMYNIEAEDLEVAMEGLSYLILHFAKNNAVDQESFDLIYETCGLNDKFKEALFAIVTGCTGELREMLIRENERGSVHFKDMDWRLNLVTATRQRQKMLFPKYTVKIDLEHQPEKQNANAKATTENLVFDLDYTNMMRLQDELQAALKSVDGQYAKKVQKFIR